MEDLGLDLSPMQAPFALPLRTPSSTPSPLDTPYAHHGSDTSANAEELHRRLRSLIMPSSHDMSDKITEPGAGDRSQSTFGPQQSPFGSFGPQQSSFSSFGPEHHSFGSFGPQQSSFGGGHGFRPAVGTPPKEDTPVSNDAGLAPVASTVLLPPSPHQQQQQLQQQQPPSPPPPPVPQQQPRQQLKGEPAATSVGTAPLRMILVPAWCAIPWQGQVMCSTQSLKSDMVPDVEREEKWTSPQRQPCQLPRSSQHKPRRAAKKQRHVQGPLPLPVVFQSFLTSAGSIGHPGCCSEPCRFAHTRKGCKFGAQCSYCHHCKPEDKTKVIAQDTGDVGQRVDDSSASRGGASLSEGQAEPRGHQQATPELAPIGLQHH